LFFSLNFDWTLDDYLPRTNISQWIARGGLGLHNQHLPHLNDLARIFGDKDESKVTSAIKAYQQKIKREFDQVLAKVG
jgi:hypothetical protein